MLLLISFALSTNSYSQCQDGNIDFESSVGPVDGVSIGSVTFFGNQNFNGGPGNILNVQNIGIEGSSLDTIEMVFDGCVDYIRFGFALSVVVDRIDAITAYFYDVNDVLIMSKSEDASQMGFVFIEGNFSDMPNMAHSVKIVINNPSDPFERYIVDNLEFTCSSCQSAPIPTLSQWSLIFLTLLISIYGVLNYKSTVHI